MVFLKDVSGNADAGTAQKWGGNQISLIDNLFDNVDISASIVNGTGKVRINTSWYFRSGKLELRNPADTFSYIFAGSAIGANRTITVPLLTGNANMVLDAITNTFTVPQVIQTSSNGTILELFGTYNTVGNEQALVYRARDSGNNTTTYAQINSQIETNTDGAEDGSLEFKLMNVGSLTTRMVINEEGDTEHILEAGRADALWLKRPRNTVGDTININFQHFDSTSAYHAYAAIRSEIIDNTNGSEDGKLKFYTSRAGTLTEQFNIDDAGHFQILNGKMTITKDGSADILDLYRTDNSTNNENQINFYLQDSVPNQHLYARINAKITDSTNGSEDGDVCIWASQNGTLSEIANFVGNEKIFRTVADVYDAIESYRPNNVINTDEAGIKLSKNSSTGVRRGVVWIYGGLTDNTNAAEDSYLHIWELRDGTSNRVMSLGPRGGLQIGPDGSNSGPVSRVVIKSGTPVNFNNTSAEQTLFTQNIIADTMGANGMIHLILLGSFRQNQATGTTYTLRCKFGGTTWYENSVGTLAQDADYLVWRLDIIVANQGDTSQQICNGVFTMNTAEAATVGWGPISDDEIQAHGVFQGTTSKTTASTNNSLAVTGQMSVANAAAEMNVDYKFLEINPSVM